MLYAAMRSNIPQKRRQAIEGLGLLVGITAFMWLIEGINSLDSQRLDSWGGIHARNIGDLWSVGTSWFLHANFSPHLVDNTIPFLFMGAFIAVHGARRLALVTADRDPRRRARDLAGVAVQRVHGRRQRGRVRLRHVSVRARVCSIATSLSCWSAWSSGSSGARPWCRASSRTRASPGRPTSAARSAASSPPTCWRRGPGAARGPAVWGSGRAGGSGGSSVPDSDPLKAHHDALDRALSH